jgi:hypothetical protein
MGTNGLVLIGTAVTFTGMLAICVAAPAFAAHRASMAVNHLKSKMPSATAFAHRPANNHLNPDFQLGGDNWSGKAHSPWRSFAGRYVSAGEYRFASRYWGSDQIDRSEIEKQQPLVCHLHERSP